MRVMKATNKKPARRRPTGFATADWTKTKQQAFLDHLAATANVAAATKKVKFNDGAAYDYRRKSTAFRAAWQAALCEGYAKLELMMLERAMTALQPAAGTGSVADPAQTKADEYSNKLVLALLAAHRTTVRGEKGEAVIKSASDVGDPRAEIEARFAQMRAATEVPTHGELSTAAQ